MSFAIDHDVMFPQGVFLVGEIQPLTEYQSQEDRARNRPVRPRIDEATGLLLFKGTFADPSAEKDRDKSFTVLFAAKVQPVPPAAMPGMPFRPVVLEGLSVQPRAETSGQAKWITWTVRATGMRAVDARRAAPTSLVTRRSRLLPDRGSFVMDIRTGKRKVPNFHTRRLCRELVELRVSAGLLQSDLFRSTNMSNQTISRIETGQLPGFLELNAMLDLYSVPSCDWKAYQDTWRLAKEVGWWERQGLRDLGYIANEHEASRIRELALVYVPLLLQTEDYARELLDTGEPTLSSKRLPVELGARMCRQRRLDGDKPVQLHALIYEPVLHHGVDEVQLQRLLDRAAQPNITVQVIPYPDVAYGGLSGPFTLLSFPYKDEPDIAYIPTPVKLIQADKPAQVACLNRIFKSVSRRAMSTEDSLAYMEKLASRCRLGGDE